MRALLTLLAALRPRGRLRISLSLSLGTAVLLVGLLVAGWADDALELVTRRNVTDRSVADLAAAQTAEDRGDPGPPTLIPSDRALALIDRAQAAVGWGALTEPQGASGDELLPGVSGVDFRSQCNSVPEAQQEANPLPIQHLTVHTSEEELPEGVGVRAVCRYHSVDLGWGHAGYHYYLSRAGTIYRLVSDTVKPYAQFTHNSHDVAIVLAGRANRGVPTEAQVSALYRLAEALFRRYGDIGVYGHVDWSDYDRLNSITPQNDHTDPGVNWRATPPHYGLDALKRRVLSPTAPPLVERPRSPTWGYATWYGAAFQGRTTRCGQTYDQEGLTTAVYLLADRSPAWPCGTVLRVTSGGRSVVVTVTDTGAFGPDPGASPGQLQHKLDLSRGAFAALADPGKGRIPVRIEVAH